MFEQFVIFAGNLYVDIIITEEDLKKQLVENGAATADTIDTYMTENKTELDKYKYERKYKGRNFNRNKSK